MKKSKRTWLLLAGVAALSATLLVPTVLSACSTTPNNENPGDDTNKPGEDSNNPGDGGNTPGDTTNKLDAQINKLNETSNASARRNIYESYVASLKISSSEIVKQEGFFDQLEEMLNGLGSESQANEVVKMLFSPENKKVMTQQGSFSGTSDTNSKEGSFWSSNAFKFRDNTDPTWSFLDAKKENFYELYLTENVEFIYESTVSTISVKVKNKATGSKVKSRLVVTSIKTTTGGDTGGSGGSQTIQGSATTPSAPTVKEYNFKDDVEFKLPENLFTGFNSFINKYDEQINASKDELKKGYKTYQDKLTTLSSAATIWNQYVGTNNSELLENMASDLNVNRESSNIAKWIIENVNSSNSKLVDDFKNDLKAAKNVYLELDSLFITGSQTDNNGLNNATGEEPDYTLIVTFDAEEEPAPEGKESSKISKNGSTDAGSSEVTQKVSLDEKWYILNLKATNFKFTTTINEQFFGYESSSFITKPTLQLDGKSSFAAYQLVTTGNTVNGYEEGDVKEITKSNLNVTGAMTDVSLLYDINNNGFTKFLSTLILDKTNQSKNWTDEMLDTNSKGAKNTISKLNDYLINNKTEVQNSLLQKDALANLILDNIDLSNIVIRSNEFSGMQHQFPSDVNITHNSKKGWREIINNWVQGDGSPNDETKPEIIVNGISKPEVPEASNNKIDTRAINVTFEQNASIVIKAKTSSGSDVPTRPLDFGNNQLKFRSIYIFLGDGSNNTETIVNRTNNQSESAGLNVDLTGDVNPVISNGQPSTNGQIDANSTWEDILTWAKGKFCVIFEKAKTNANQGIAKTPLYGFYMGQQKLQSSKANATTNQSKFSISLDSLLGDGSKFLDALLAKE